MASQAEHLLEDEISLTELALKLWQRRALIVAVMGLAFLGGLGFMLAKASQIRTPITHFINLTAIEKGAYPNGTAFSVQDIVSPRVLSELARRTGYEAPETLRDAISVSLNAPVSIGIMKKYQAMLDRRSINQAEIDLINATLAEELAAVTDDTVRITVDYQALGLSRADGEYLALMFPQSWTHIYVRQFRVLDNTRLQGLAVITDLPLTSGLGGLEAERILRNLGEGLTLMAEDSRLQSLQTKEGVTPADLRRQISDFRAVYMSAILSQNMNISDAMRDFYLSDLAVKIEQMDDQPAGLDAAIQEIKDILDRQKPDAANSKSSLSSGLAGGQIQLGAGAIAEIISLVNDSALSSYLTGLFDAQHALIQARSELRTQIRQATTAAPFPEDILDRAQATLDAIIASYNELLGLARQMHRRNISELHTDLGSPIILGSPLPEKGPLILALSVVVGLFFSVFLALILPLRSHA